MTGAAAAGSGRYWAWKGDGRLGRGVGRGMGGGPFAPEAVLPPRLLREVKPATERRATRERRR